VKIDGREVEIPRARLGLFLQLERIGRDYLDAISKQDSGACVDAMHQYIRTASGIEFELGKDAWYDFYATFMGLKIMNTIDADIPMLKHPTRIKDDPPWDHPDRPYLIWIHIIASTYGWPRSEIEDLWPETAAAFVQEIALDDQFEKEWEHALSPIAHPRDKRGKDLYQPLVRPPWMAGSRVKKQKFLRKTLPVGTIIDLSGVDPGDLDD
jgi:hypothetical protein